MSRVSYARRGIKTSKGIPNVRGYGTNRRRLARLYKSRRWWLIDRNLAVQMYGASQLSPAASWHDEQWGRI